MKVVRRYRKPARPSGPMTIAYARNELLDNLREWVTDDPTFANLRTLIRSADDGDIGETLRAYEEMEVKDARLGRVADTRRMALTGLDWGIISAAEDQRFKGDRGLADEAAAYVSEALTTLSWVGVDNIPKTIEDALRHLSGAIGPNLALCEIIWNGPDVAKLEAIPSHRVCANPQDLSELWIQTGEHLSGEPLERDKWIVHRPRSRPGTAYTASLSYAVSFIWLVKSLALVDFSTYVSRFGVPMIWAKVGKEPSSTEKAALQEMLGAFGTTGWAMFSDQIEASVLESSQRGTTPQQVLIEYCDKELAIAYLGQNLTTDTAGATGTYAAASVHDRVRADILADDIASEGATIRGQLIAPMCKYRYPGREVPLPYFQRIIPQPRDESIELDKITKAQAAGAPVSKQYLYDTTGIEPPKEGDDADRLEPVSGNPFADEGPL